MPSLTRQDNIQASVQALGTQWINGAAVNPTATCLWFTALWQGRARLRRLMIGFGPGQPLKSIQLFHNYRCHIAVRVATDEQIHVRIIRNDPLIV